MNAFFSTVAAISIAVSIFISVAHQKAQQAEQARQAAAVSTSGLLEASNLLKADSKSLEDWKRVLTLRQTALASMCHVFTTHHLTIDMQRLLDMDYYLTISQPRGAELGSKSGLVATRAILESLAVDWPEGARPTTLEETISEIQTYAVVYTIYWQAAEGTARGFYKFEHRLNLQTGETVSVRLLQAGDLGS